MPEGRAVPSPYTHTHQAGLPRRHPAAPPLPPPLPHPGKVVTLKRAQQSYVLYQCGTPNPARLPAGAAEGVAPGMAAFEVPLHSVAVTDTTVNGFLVGRAGLGGGEMGAGASGGASR